MPPRRKYPKAPAPLLKNVDLLVIPQSRKLTEATLQGLLSHLTLFATPTSSHVLGDGFFFRFTTISADALENLGDPALGWFLRAYPSGEEPDDGLPCSTFDKKDIRSLASHFRTAQAVESILPPASPAVPPADSQPRSTASRQSTPAPPSPSGTPNQTLPENSQPATPKKKRTITPPSRELRKKPAPGQTPVNSDGHATDSEYDNASEGDSTLSEHGSHMSTELGTEEPFSIQEHQRRKIKHSRSSQPRTRWPVPQQLRPFPAPSTDPRRPDELTLLVRPIATYSFHNTAFHLLQEPLSAVGNITSIRNIRGGGLALDFAPGADLSKAPSFPIISHRPARIDKPCRTPCRSGIIGGVPLHLTDEEIMDLANSQSSSSYSIRRAQRLGKPDDPSQTVKLVFNGDSLPQKLLLNGLIHPVQPFVSKPRQCHRCQRFSHTREECHSKLPRCRLCSKAHEEAACTEKDTCCANCLESHPANDPRCKSRKTANLIASTAAQNSISLLAAKELLSSQEKPSPCIPSRQQEPPAEISATSHTLTNILSAVAAEIPGILPPLMNLVSLLTSPNPQPADIYQILKTLAKQLIQTITAAILPAALHL